MKRLLHETTVFLSFLPLSLPTQQKFYMILHESTHKTAHKTADV
uniref:Uncharacterized protein n=1 Tax=Arundo donax TaxID=35708 RepID=A0A0A9FB48_ARUDO